jgi:hypothetical protein
MNEDYNIVLKIPADVYEAWQEFAKSKQVKVFGHKASITGFTSGYVTKMMEKVLKEAGI